MRWPDRHGRWPLASAAGLLASLPILWSRRESLTSDAELTGLLPAVALLAHQTEEWVKPGGFLPWFNREVMESGADEFPITRRDGLAINAGLGWGTAAAAVLAGPDRPGPAAAQLAMHLGNAGLHLSQVARRRRYNPGSATSALLFAPLGIVGMRRLLAGGERRAEAIAGAAAGVASAAGMLVTMRRRVRSAGG
ncbi:HXXEE domain-containing protein [Thermoleophilia bacterium SCSIO 60948]|nr:HXXEE domain-containing protein [Thermoleophilia bacterium SCSIO 60948]